MSSIHADLKFGLFECLNGDFRMTTRILNNNNNNTRTFCDIHTKPLRILKLDQNDNEMLLWTSSRMSTLFLSPSFALYTLARLLTPSHSLAFLVLVFHVYILHSPTIVVSQSILPIFTAITTEMVEPLENCVLWVNSKANATKIKYCPWIA